MAVAAPGWAGLGGRVDSVAADQDRFRGTRKLVQMRGGFTIHEIARADGTLIKEYVSSAGAVFGVSWQGPVIPDLSQLLGSYFPEFQSSVQSKPGRRRAAVVRNSDLVVESAGHMRAFHGRAYLNSQLPAGLSGEAIQ